VVSHLWVGERDGERRVWVRQVAVSSGWVLYWHRCARSMVSVDHAIGHSGSAMGYGVMD
jgi:hypothetical protein